MSASGVKRLLGAINREMLIVDDFENCVYTSRRQKNAHTNRYRVNNWKQVNNFSKKDKHGYQTESDIDATNVAKLTTQEGVVNTPNS